MPAPQQGTNTGHDQIIAPVKTDTTEKKSKKKVTKGKSANKRS